MISKYAAYQKVRDVFDSCTHVIHIQAARKYMNNYFKLYGIRYADFIWFDLDNHFEYTKKRISNQHTQP